MFGGKVVGHGDGAGYDRLVLVSVDDGQDGQAHSEVFT